MKEPSCTLYTFLWHTPDGIKTVKIARLTNDVPDDWYDWAEANHP